MSAQSAPLLGDERGFGCKLNTAGRDYQVSGGNNDSELRNKQFASFCVVEHANVPVPCILRTHTVDEKFGNAVQIDRTIGHDVSPVKYGNYQTTNVTSRTENFHSGSVIRFRAASCTAMEQCAMIATALRFGDSIQ